MVLPFHKIARLQSTSYYRTKSCYYRTTTFMDTFLEVLRKENSKISKISKKKLQNCPFFSSATMCSPEFSTSTKTDCQKNVSGEFSEIWKLVRERSIMKSFTIHYWNSITTQNLHVYEQNNIIYFSVNTSKNCWFERSSTKTSWIELSHHRFVVRVWPPVMRRRELSTAVTRIMCMESGWNW